MMDVQIELNDYSTTGRDVRRCLNTLYSTPIGTVALDRDFGIDWSFLDTPTEAAKAWFVSELIQKTMKYEPRANVSEVTWNVKPELGTLEPKVVIELV